MKAPRLNTIIFDCDGTLLNTYPLICETVIRTFRDCFPDYHLSPEEVDSFFGPVLEDSFRRYTSDETKFREAIETYRKYNLELHPQYVSAFPGVSKTLHELKQMGYHLAIVSNKLTNVIEYGLKTTGIEDCIDVIIGSDVMSLPKPDPDGIYKVLKRYPGGRAVMVGDSRFDILAAKNAGIASVGVTWCKTTKAEFEAIGADFIISRMEELKKVLELIE